jgi:hypothetical protein
MRIILKNLNIFGLCAMVLAAGIVFTQSAFTPAKNNKVALIYGYDQTNPSNPWVLEGTEGYRCNRNPNFCKYVFETPPTAETDPTQSIPLSSEDTNRGSYQSE